MFVLVVGFLVPALPAAAQTTAGLPSRTLTLPAQTFAAESPAQQIHALQRWTHDFDAWKAWFLQWRSRIEPGFLSARARREEPVPPAWLPDACTSLVDDGGPLAEACRAWHEWLHVNDGTGVMTQQAAQVRSRQEAPDKTVWWERLHIDALWPMAQSGTSAFGVAGMHATLNVTDRFQVFLAPGAILMRVPTGDGRRAWSAATDWGFSYRVFDVRLPGMEQRSTVHLNIARVWVLGADVAPTTGNLYLAGFSISFKRR